MISNNQPSQAFHFYTLVLLLGVGTGGVEAFVPLLPTTSTTTATLPPYNGVAPLQYPHQRRAISSRHRPLFVVADAPNPANNEREKRKRGEKNNDENDDDDDSWVATKDGGFLPRIPRALRQKFGSSRSSSSSSETIQPSSSSSTTTTQPVQTKPETVVTIQEYKAVVADEKHQMVCVRFFAPWCKACKAVQQPYRKLCRELSPQGVKFVEVPLTKENAFLHEGLGIPSLPYGHIYHPAVGLVEECKINLKKQEFASFEKALKTYVRGECQVDYSTDEPSEDDE